MRYQKTIIVRVPDYARFVIRDSSKLAFFIHIRFTNNANGHIRRICSSFNIRVNWCQFVSDFFDKKDANHHVSRIVWPHPNADARLCSCSRFVMRNSRFVRNSQIVWNKNL